MELCTLDEAIARHVRPGDSVHVALGHHRWTAAARELARQFWGADPGFELVMSSLGSLGALFFAGGLLRRVVTAYSGDSFPTYSPNPIFRAGYESGEVEVENWSFLSLIGRLEAAARGLPAVTTRSIGGSSMAANPAYAEIDTPYGRTGLLAPLTPDVALLHAPMADRAGNVAVAQPSLEGVWGAHAARRGAVVTVERVVDDLSRVQQATMIPAHRVLAVVEAPFGAHPGGVYAGGLPVTPYAEDIPFWVEARDAARGDFDAWAQEWCLRPATHQDYLRRLGADRLVGLRRRADSQSWREDDVLAPADTESPPSGWEVAASLAARELVGVVRRTRADAVLAGAGVANLAAWAGVAAARADGLPVSLTAELGLWGYTPTPADPFIFNHRAFPSAPMTADARTVLGMLVGGPGTTTVGCLGAAQVDRAGNINSTQLSPERFLVGSGGGNDVASRAAECMVVTLLRPARTPERDGYVTGPGTRVRTVVTDLGVLRKTDGDELRLAAVPAGPEPLAERTKRAINSCGWALETEREVAELTEVKPDEVAVLRGYDRHRVFLGGG